MTGNDLFKCNRFFVYANDVLVPRIANIYEDARGIVLCRYHYVDDKPLVDTFPATGGIHVVLVSQDQRTVRVFSHRYNSVVWDPVRFRRDRDQYASEAVILKSDESSDTWALYAQRQGDHDWSSGKTAPEQLSNSVVGYLPFAEDTDDTSVDDDNAGATEKSATPKKSKNRKR